MQVAFCVLLFAAAAAVAEADQNSPGAFYEHQRNLVAGHPCMLAKHVADARNLNQHRFLEDPHVKPEALESIGDRHFNSVVPVSAEKAYEAFHQLNSLLDSYDGGVCDLSPDEQSKLQDALDLVNGVYYLVDTVPPENKTELYNGTILSNWGFLPQAWGKLTRLIEEGHFCKSKLCAKLEFSEVIGITAGGPYNVSIDEISVNEEIRRVENVKLGQCDSEQLEKEKHCGSDEQFSRFVFGQRANGVNGTTN